MNKVENITSEYLQTHTLEFSRGVAVVELKYHSVVQIWTMNITYTRADEDTPQRPINGVKLSLSTTHIKHRNWPFDFTVVDTSETGVDPFRSDDFESGRCELYFITPSEMIQVRGVDVQ